MHFSQRNTLIIFGIGAIIIGCGAGLAFTRSARIHVQPTPTPDETIPILPSETPTISNEIVVKRPLRKNYEDIMTDARRDFAAGRFDLVVDETTTALKMENTQTEPISLRGQAYLKLLNGDKAAADFSTLIVNDPKSIPAKISNIQALILAGKFDDLRIFLTQNQSLTEVKYYMAILNCSTGGMETCRSGLNDVVKKQDNESYMKKAQIVLDAFQQYDLFNDSDSVHERTLIAQALLNNGEPALAQRLLKIVVGSVQNYRDAWILYGYSLYLLQKYPDALDALERAESLDQKKGDTQYFLGLTELKLNHPKEAIAHLLFALQYKASARLDIQKYLADTYVDEKDYDSALKYYLDIVNDGVSKDINAYVRPMWIYIEMKKDPNQALILAEKAMERYPTSAMAHNLKGWALLASGKNIDAESELNAALKIDVNLQAAYFNLGELYLGRADNDKARTAYKKAYDLDPNSTIGASAAAKYNSLQ